MNTYFKSSSDVPLDILIEMLKKAFEEKTNGVLVVVTNGVDNPGGMNKDTSQMVIQQRPDSVSQGLFNQAVTFNEIPYILDFCDTLENIAKCTRDNIYLEIKHRQQNN